MTAILKLYLATLLMTCSNPTFADGFSNEFSGIWSIKGSSQQDKWIVIHNIDNRNGNTIYHIEILSRKKTAPLWKIEHLAPHMAITKPALSKSIIKQLRRGAVYPESYNFAYHKWLIENSNTGGFVCSTSIAQCIIH